MSAINTGVYPSPNVTTTEAEIVIQTQEITDLVTAYDTLEGQLATTNSEYDDSVALFDFQNTASGLNIDNKPIGVYQKTSYTRDLLTSETTKVWVNSFSTASDASLYVNLNVNFLTPQVNPIHSICWIAVVNEGVFCKVFQDLGDYIVTDLDNKWTIPFILKLPSGSSVSSTYITAQIFSDFVMEVPVQIAVRVYKMDSTA
jgi:hypothetical protein